MRHTKILSWCSTMLLVLMFVLAACGGDDADTPTSTSSAGAAETQVAEAVAATLTAQPAATLAPTMVPQATRTPAPTSTRQPTSAPTATVEPTATSTIAPTPQPTVTSTATPTLTPTDVPAPAPPPLGENVNVPPLSEWAQIDEDRYTGFAGDEGSYHLRITEPCSGVYVCGVTTEALEDVGRVDLSVEVDVRLVTATSLSSSSCVALGYEDADGHFSEFWLCTMADGKTFAAYADGNVSTGTDTSPTFLLPPAVHAGTNPASEWNRLQIIVDGDQAWFIANGTVLHRDDMVASASEIPTIGIHIGNTGDPPVEFEFSGLAVHLVN